MAKHYHTEVAVSTTEMRVGPEIWMVTNYNCSECGKFIRYVIISRRKA